MPVLSTALPTTAKTGEQMCFDIGMGNAESSAGFGPYIRLDLPMEMTLDSASFFGASVDITSVGVFPESGLLMDPITGDTVSSVSGRSLSLVSLPLGSVVANGPALSTQVCSTIDTAVAVGTSLTVSAQGVFEFGDTTTGVNGAIEGEVVSDTLMTTVVAFSSSLQTRDNKSVPGPSFSNQFIDAIDVANGKSVFDVSLQHSLDPNLQYIGSSHNGGSGFTAVSKPSTIIPGGSLISSFSSVVGTKANSEASVSYSAYVTDILDESQCAPLRLNTHSSLDIEHPDNNPLPQITDNLALTAKHLIINQGVSPNQVSPGDTITYSNVISLTEYGTADSLVVTNTLPDGVSFDSHLNMQVNGSTVAIAPMVTSNNAVTTVSYDVHAVTGNLESGSQITITYRAEVNQEYQAGDAVLAADKLNASAQASYSLTDGASSCSDSTNSSVSITPVSNDLSILLPQAEYVPNETVTFRQELQVPSGDTNNIVFETYLPLPVFDVSSLNINFGTDIRLGASSTVTLVPTNISIDAATNKLRIEWPNFTSVKSETLAVDIDISITAVPFADGLTLATLFLASTENSPSLVAQGSSLVNMQVRAPELQLTYGIAASDNAVANATLVTSTPVDSDISQSDAGDKLTLVISAENIGGANAHDVVITAPLIAGMTSASLVSVTDGEGKTINSAGDLFGSGLTLTDPLPKNDGSIGAPLTTDTVLITYEVLLDNSVKPNQVLIPEAGVTWAPASGATLFPAVEDMSYISMEFPNVATQLTAVAPEGHIGNVVVGDVVTYTTTVTLPEGTTEALNVSMDLPAGFAYVDSSIAVNTAGFAGTVDTSPTLNTSGAVDSGQSLSVAFDSPSNTLVNNDNFTSNNSFSFSINALVTNSSALTALTSAQSRNLDVGLTYQDQTGTAIKDSAAIDFTEHKLAVSASFSPASGLASGDLVEVTIELSNTGTAPAYDVVLTDVLNANLFDVTSALEATTPANFSYSFVSPTVTYTTSSAIAPGQSLTFSYTANVKQGVVTGSSYDNNVSVVGDSQQGDISNPDRDSNDSATPTAAIGSLAISELVLIDSTESWTSDAVDGVEAAIGETLTYRLTVDVPQGVSIADVSQAIIDINLPDGAQYIVDSSTINAVNSTTLQGAKLTGGLSPIPTAVAPITPLISNGVLGFDLGDLTNSDSDSADTEQLQLIFSLLVDNTAANERTNVKSVIANVNYQNVNANPQTASQTSVYNIVEADLKVSNQVSPSSAAGGEPVVFTSVISNKTSSDATRGWEWAVSSELSARLENLRVTSATLSRADEDLLTCFSFSGNTLVSDASCLTAEQHYLAPGESITLVYSATLDPSIGFEERITSKLKATVTSLPGSKGSGSTAPGLPNSDNGERTGSGVDNDSGQQVNDLLASGSAKITAGKPSINLSAATSDLPILATTTVTATMAIPVGTTDNFVFTYDLPEGLTYTGTPVNVQLPASNFVASKSPNVALTRGDDPLVFDFGSIHNSAAGAQNIAIEIEVEVDNSLANQAGEALTVGASASYDNASAPPQTNIDINVIEANLSLSKTITAGATGSDAGDTVSYRIVLTNEATDANAYRVALSDVLPAGLLGAPDGSGSGISFNNITLQNDQGAVLSSGGASLSQADAQITTTNLADDTLGWPLFTLPATATITIDYDIVISNNVLAGDLLTNTAEVHYNSLLDGSGRDASDSMDDDQHLNIDQLNNYGERVTQTLTVDSLISVQQSLAAGQADNKFAIGEKVIYDIRIDLIEGSSDSVVLTDVLPLGMSFVESQVIAGSHISYSGAGTAAESPMGTLTFDFGEVSNTADGDIDNNNFTVRVVALLEDEVANTAGKLLDNTVSVTTAAGDAGPDIETIIVAEPQLNIIITPDLNQVSLGDKVSFTVEVEHDGSSADAFDNQFELILPPELSYVANSHTGDGALDNSAPSVLAIDFGSITQVEDQKSFTFEALVDNSADINKVLTIAVANGSYSSRPGTPLVERQYPLTGSAQVTTKSLSFIDVAHRVDIAVDNGDAGVIEAGDTLVYTITITNKGPLASEVVYYEALPNNTHYDVTNVASSSQGSIELMSLPDMVFNIGAMDTNETVTLTYHVVVDDGVTAGTQIRAQGAVDSERTVPELSDADANDSNGDQATIVYVQDRVDRLDALYIQQTAQWINDFAANGDISPKDTMKISYFIQNLSANELTNVSVDEVLPRGVTYVAATAMVAGSNTINVLDDDIAVTIASLAAGQVIVAEYQVTIDDPLYDSDATPTIETFTHSAIGNSDQTGEIASDSNGNQSDGYQAVRYTAVSGGVSEPEVEVYLDWTLINDVDGDGLVDPGDQVQYHYTVVNSGATTAKNSRLVNDILANSKIVANSGYTSQGLVTNEGPFELNLGGIAPGSVINAGYIVTIAPDTANGTVIANQGQLSGNNFNPVLSDDNAEAADGLNPTLLTVSVASQAGQPLLAVNLVETSLPETSAGDFIQGEELTVDLVLTLPTGRTADLILNLTLPQGLAIKPSSPQLKRIFDTALTASAAPANLNTAASDTFVDASAAIVVNGLVNSVVFGSVINSDGDNDTEHYVLRVVLQETGLVPTMATEDFPLQATFSYVDHLNTNVTSEVVVQPLQFLNRLPIALADDMGSIDEDSPSLIFDVLANDIDFDIGHSISLTGVSTPASGSLVSIVAGKVSYTPAANFYGPDQVTYTIVDNAGGLSSALLRVNVIAVNDVPTAVADSYSLAEGATLNVGKVAGVLRNDTDVDGDELIVTLVSGVSHGSLTLNSDGSFSYQHDGAQATLDSFSYRVSDGTSYSDAVTVTINITPVNDAPVASNDSLTLTEDSTGVSFPLANDVDADGDPLTITSASASHGTVTIGSEGSILYTPEADFHGEDQISYCIEDPQGLTDCAIITVTVISVNDRPVALDDRVTTEINQPVMLAVLSNDSDSDGDTLSVIAVAQSSLSVVVNPNNTLTITPPADWSGEVSFSYTISDNNEIEPLTAQAKVTVIVEEEPVNQPPVTQDDIIVVNDWSQLSILPLANDSDPDGDNIRLLSASVDFGQLTISGNEIRYTPAEGYMGEVVIEYLIADEEGLTAVGYIRLSINSDDDSMFPVISVPADLCGDLTVNANALYTRVDIGAATAIDSFGNPLPVSIINDNLLFPPGQSQAYWQATDSEGRVSIAAQNICVRPLVSFQKDQTVLEGEEVTVSVHLNGRSEIYPLSIPYQLSGSASSGDYHVVTSELVIESGTHTEIRIDILMDELVEADETIVFTLDPSVNRGAQYQHQITITEGNIAPELTLTVTQQDETRLTVSRTAGMVMVDSHIYDANIADTWTLAWQSQLSNQSDEAEIFSFDPASVAVGVYPVTLVVTDSGEPALQDKSTVYIQVVESLAVLTDADSDGDLIPDYLEGYADSDGDGTPDYLDRVSECNVLFESYHSQNQYLIEGDPGVCLRRGQLTYAGDISGALISDHASDYADYLPIDSQAVNVGGIMDFIAYGLPDNHQAYRVVTPLRKPIPQSAVYRKYRSESGWGDFVEDANNSLWSTSGEPGYCPPTGSPLWRPGLNEGDWCVQLIIQDGGANDDDGIVNGTIIDPGYVGTLLIGNQQPVAEDDQLTVGVDSINDIDVLVNDSDADGDILTITSASARFGRVEIVDGQLRYHALSNLIGSDLIDYAISDGNGGTAYGIVNITILANQAPIAVDDYAEVKQGEQVGINVLANDSDPDGGVIRLVSAEAENGSVQLDANGLITYTPNAGFSGEDTIRYVIEDAFGMQAEAIVKVKVIEVINVHDKTESSGGSVNLWSLLILFMFVCLYRRNGFLLSRAKHLLLVSDSKD
ncbi:putative outer membrane adhesin like protein [Shewanella pealeana ATCC 700345]|uniref:Putative outer membrane adhesin like protein n=1 Tax=Shewanella pealeana (strain ATCC 700345 / ANG-SQ1) TaxID=398579 RepID=A8H9E2_SHEPA|nr:putative outer membrane adhesin like protein [Shewanella pealeana ATCC 700345]